MFPVKSVIQIHALHHNGAFLLPRSTSQVWQSKSLALGTGQYLVFLVITIFSPLKEAAAIVLKPHLQVYLTRKAQV